MNNLINYIYGILMFVILITILEMILPNGNSKKYVKLVSGFLLTFIVLTPIINIFANENDIKDRIEDGLSKIDTKSSSIEAINQQIYIDNLFEEGIKNDISNIILNMGYKVDYINVKYNKNEKGEFTNITNINIHILEKIENEDIQSIQKVSVVIENDDSNKNEDKVSALEDNIKQEIINSISDRYKVDKSCIFIN